MSVAVCSALQGVGEAAVCRFSCSPKQEKHAITLMQLLTAPACFHAEMV
jgi:hypothetical protein